MNYREQRTFLIHTRIWGAIAVLCIISWATICLVMANASPKPVLMIFGLTMVALASSVYYTPDYLHLTVTRDKKLRWQMRIRWRVIGAVIIMTIFSVSSFRAAAVALAALLWLVGANLVAKSFVHPPSVSAYFWLTDFGLAIGTFLAVRYDFLMTTALLAAAGHLSVVTWEKRTFVWSAVVGGSGCAWILLSRQGEPLQLSLASVGVYLISVVMSAWLVNRAQRQNARNVNEAMRELMAFTGYPEDRIRTLWAVSNQELANHWKLASLSENETERIKQWYQEHSGLYLFAISAYNLEYKRIKSNLKMLKLAAGSCLDYGAGNGELILELARRNHLASYYDVEGETMKFAQWRAQRQGLAIDFLRSKAELTAKARDRSFDTVFSFDVLEHVPDLPEELSFLCALLNPGGMLVFDVPAGTTKSHPMHLNHNLDIREFLQGKGLGEKRAFLQKLPFRKQEKYFFTAADNRTASQAANRLAAAPPVG